MTDDLMREIRGLPTEVIKLAILYAYDMIHYGVDITQKLETVTQQHAALYNAYIRGRQDEHNRYFGGRHVD